MNQKRWLAVAIAIVILVMSAVTPAVSHRPNAQETTTNLGLDNLLFNQRTLNETVLEAGDDSARILVLNLNGTIMPTSSGLFSSNGYDHDFMLEQLARAAEDQTIKGILFKVNTPGGGVYQSAEIRNAILKIKEKRNVPIYVSMLSMAASGGYYVSADATKIFATEETWTGSIGVIMQAINLTEFFDKHGISSQTYKSGALKDMGSSYRKPTAEDAAVFQGLVDDAYDKFVDIIVKGRGMDEATVRKIADGRIYTAKQALDNHLIDAIAYPDEVLAALKSENNLTGSTVFEYKKGSGNEILALFEKATTALRGNDELAQIKQLLEQQQQQTLQPYYLFGGQ